MRVKRLSEGRNITGFYEEPALHGGAIDAARLKYPHAVLPWIDLSTGISPNAYPIPDLDHDLWSRLPLEKDYGALLLAAAERYGAPGPDHIVAAPGTQAVIQLLARLYQPRSVVIVGPTFDEHERCWRRAGHDVGIVEDIDEALRARPDVVVVVNPNNPTGFTHSAERLVSIAGELALKNGVLVVDEAFVDLCDFGISLVCALPDNAIILRSIGKTYGLAGLRLGFAVGSPPVVARLREELGPWAVSGPALFVGTRALSDEVWLDAQRSRLATEVGRLLGCLSAAGSKIVGATALFVLGSFENAAAVRDGLAQRGIHVRHFPEHPTWLRFGIPGDEAAWQRLSDALLHSSLRR